MNLRTLRRLVLLLATSLGASCRSDADRARLGDRYLRSADLSYAHLSGANLIRASLNHANLTDADLTNANLTGARLSGVNLTGANLTGANLTEVHCEVRPRWPDGFSPPICLP